MKNYTLYCTSKNTFCRLAETTLMKHNIAFETVNVDKASISKAELARMIGPDVHAVPQLFYGTEYVGNFHDLQKQLGAV